jgi:hypothetical protein
VKLVLGLYVPLPLTDAVPTTVPPVVQFVGAVDCGPNTVNVTLPDAVLVAPVSVAPREPTPIGDPVVALAGAPAVILVVLVTTVDVIPLPQALVAGLFIASPL